MTREQFTGVAVGLVTVILTLAVLRVEAQYELTAAPRAKCVDQETHDRIIELSLRGYDEAFVRHTVNLWTIWTTDSEETPVRAQRGSQNGINAYVRARKYAKDWTAPIC